MSQDSIIVEPSESLSEEQEAQEAQTKADEAAAAKAKDEAIPEKYRNKTTEEVIAMHQNLEKEYGRQANEVGTYRELVSSLAETKRSTDLSEGGPTEEKTVEVTSDSLWDDPQKAISTVVKDVLAKELAPIRETQAASGWEQQIAALKKDHPDMETIGADPRFQQFVERSPYRVADAQKWVSNQDVDAGRRLLEDFKEYSGTALTTGDETEETTETVETTDPLEAARKASTESGRGGGGGGSKKTIRRSEVMKLIAKDPERYRSPSFQAELKAAIAEGRFVAE